MANIIEFTYTQHTLPYTIRSVTWDSPQPHYFSAVGTPTGANSNFYLYASSTKPAWLVYDRKYQLIFDKTGLTNKLLFLIQTRVGSTYSNIIRVQNNTEFIVPAANYNYFNIVLIANRANGAVNEIAHPYVYELVEYTPRLNSQGIAGSRWYEWGNPFYLSGYGMPNCTAYAFGRFWEIADPNNIGANYPNLSLGNADSWFNHADQYPRGTTPQLGAIACYSGGMFSGDGHVCVVEEIDTVNQRCRVSESAYNGYYFRATHWIDYNGDYGYGGYHFDGFIYNPYAGDQPMPPGPVEGFDLWKFNQLINKRKGVLLT